uniref:Uncharacterized mitochondrial protein AtMg00810-like n=1 Tax=Tanacetum cinerariifolium TaxID=118510 RepID=A0A6L2MD88_TANCI|nr:uncharacterized mitochondrial protein AtMg00810-like [Tanacetum cinerariifolium]
MSIGFESLMHDKFQMSSVGELSFFLGLKVQQKSDGIFISQDKYVADILKKFDFSTVKTVSTPMDPNKALVNDAKAKDVDVHLYRSMIGSLMYLTAFRPDITFSICACARFQVTPKTSHLYVVKIIFRYLKGQPKLGLCYPRDSPFDLEAYSNNDYAEASLDRKSTTGSCQFLGKRLISWQCKRQTIVANFTTKAEYVVAASCYGQEDRMKRVTTNASSLEAEQDSGNINRTQSMATLNEHLPRGIGSGSGPRCQVTILGGAEAQTMFEVASKQSNDLPLSREKPSESEGFEQIIDFLNAKPIRYALMVNPTVYASCVKQFWTTAKVKKVNDQEHIQALVDKQKVIITEESIRSDLKFDDAEGTACLPNDTIFEELARIGAKTTAWSEFSSTMASAIICLANNQNFNFSKYIFDRMVKHLEGGVKLLMFLRFLQVFLNKQVEGMAKHKKIYVISSHTKNIFANMRRQGQGFFGNVTTLFETMMVHAQEQVGRVRFLLESILTPANDLLPGGEDSIQLNELITFCTNLQQQVLDIEEAKIAQAKEIAKLKKRDKKLEKRKKSRPERLRRLKKGRSIEYIDQDVEIALVDKSQERMHDADMFGVNDLEGNEVFVDVREKIIEKEVSTADPVTTAGEVVTAASVEYSPAPTTATITDVDDELTLAKTLTEIKAAKPKEERIAREKDEANRAVIEEWDDVQATIDADRRKYFAAKRAEEIRNKPPTKAQQKSLMCTYMRNIEGFKQKDFKGKSFDDIKKIFDNIYKRVNIFVDMDTENVEEILKKT